MRWEMARRRRERLARPWLGRLTEQQRVILALRLLGCTAAGVAAYLGCTTACAKNQTKHVYRLAGVPRWAGGMEWIVGHYLNA